MTPELEIASGQPPQHKTSLISNLKNERIQESATEHDSRTTSSQPDDSSKPYTTFTSRDKRLLTLLLGFATITSPLTATIYFLLLPLLRNHFHTSAQAINITLTIYIIFQAISPAIFGPLSDSLGRRPVYLLTLSLYAIGNLGLAVNKHSYVVLIILRTVQSLRASAAFAVSYGIVADICVPSERGSMLGPVSMALNLGACIGPVIGGWVAYKSGSYKWIFWVLVIIGVVLLLSVGALLPETARSVVDDGSKRKKQRGWEESWYQLCKHWLQKDKDNERKEENEKQPENKGDVFERSLLQRFRIPNP